MNIDPRFSLDNPQYVAGLDMAHDIERSRAAGLAAELQLAESAATHDPLTGALNLKGLEDHLETLDAAGDESAMLFVDGDNMKTINDTLGHAAGDEAILGTAKSLSDCTREADVVARIGGDEFVVVLSKDRRDAGNELSLDQIVANTTARLTKCVAEFQRTHPDLTEKGFDLSVGAAVRNPGDDFDDVKARAETLMYEHKKRQEKALTPNQQAIMAGLARQAIAAGIPPRDLASFMRSFQS